ncbi:hypothetical protein ACVWZX_001180 [Deinococcus sp. UYEF24]
MPAWTEGLDPILRNRLRALLSSECQFIWRNRESGESSVEPLVGQTCWWEAWHSETLLTFSGPYRGPISGEALNAMLLMFLPNLESVVSSRARSWVKRR